MKNHKSDITTIINIVNKYKNRKEYVVELKTLLLEDAGIDSLALVELIEEIQQQCQVVFLPSDYSPDRFASVATIVELVAERRSP